MADGGDFNGSAFDCGGDALETRAEPWGALMLPLRAGRRDWDDADDKSPNEGVRVSLRAPAEPFRTSFAFPGVGFGLAALIGTGDTLGVEAAEYCAISAVAGGLTKRASMFSVSILVFRRPVSGDSEPLDS